MTIRICGICNRSINDGSSRVLWSDGLAHASCRDAYRANAAVNKPVIESPKKT